MSVDPPEASEALRRRLDAPFTFLSDRDGVVLDLLDVRQRGGRRDGADIAYPSQVLVDADGIVRWTYASDYFRVRADPREVMAEIAKL